MQIQFNEENHPELMDVPLKGEMLREFLAVMRFDQRYMAGVSPDATLTRMLGKIVGLLEVKLAHADDFGLDIRDMRRIIKGLVYTDPASVGTDALGAEIRQAEEEHGEITPEVAEKVIAHVTMNKFSLCLALQEGKEQALLAAKDKVLKAQMANINAAFDEAPFSDEEMGAMLAEHAQIFLSTQSKNEELIRSGSKIAKLNAVISEDVLSMPIDLMIDRWLNIDPTTHAGYEEHRRVRDSIMADLSAHMGLPPRQ